MTTIFQTRPKRLEKIFGTNESQMSISGIDECASSINICGMEAGCHNTIDGYKCLCHMDLKPVDPKTKSCDRNQTNTTTHQIYNPESTLATFGGKQLMKIFSPGKNGLMEQTKSLNVNSYYSTRSCRIHERLLEELNYSQFRCEIMNQTLSKTILNSVILTNEQNMSKNNNYHSNINFMSFNPFVFSIVVLFAAFFLSSLGIYCHKRIKRINRRKLNQIPLTGNLSKCMQQYVTNPNYYGSSPDAPMLKFLRDIELCEEDITFEEEIGEGCFGTVFKGTYKKSDATIIQVAIKVLKDKGESRDDFEREIEIISSFNHMNIIQLIGVVVKDCNSIPYMVFEYMMYGDLAELLRSKKSIKETSHNEIESIDEIMSEDKSTEISHENLIWISTQIANGCQYLADNHFVHRDLATRNCLVGLNLTVKISDFGMSRDIYTCDYYKVGGSKLLPVRWMSPESILYGKFTLESDVWSFGVILWEIYTLGKQPYFGHNNEEVVKLILQGILLIPPEDCPKCIYELMANCWKTEPRNRINFSTILKQLLKNCTTEKQKLISSNIKIKEDEEILDIDNYLVPNYSNSYYSSDTIV